MWLKGLLNDPLTHIGEYLLGKSRAQLEKRIGYHPDVNNSTQTVGVAACQYLIPWKHLFPKLADLRAYLTWYQPAEDISVRVCHCNGSRFSCW